MIEWTPGAIVKLLRGQCGRVTGRLLDPCEEEHWEVELPDGRCLRARGGELVPSVEMLFGSEEEEQWTSSSFAVTRTC